MPRSPAISWVTSSGKPKVSWSLKATVAGHVAVAPLGERRRRAGVTPRVSVRAEAALLAVDDPDDAVAVGARARGRRRPSRRCTASTSAGEHEVVDAEQVGEAHGPADDATQHVAAVLVRRDDAVGDEEGHGAGVVGQHPEGDVGRCVGAEGCAR